MQFTAKPQTLPELPPFPEDLDLAGTGGGRLEWLFVSKAVITFSEYNYQNLACIRDGEVGYISGAILRHPDRETGAPCSVFLEFHPSTARSYPFFLLSTDPPHVSESVICTTCGAHAYLHQGEWPSGNFWYNAGPRGGWH